VAFRAGVTADERDSLSPLAHLLAGPGIRRRTTLREEPAGHEGDQPRGPRAGDYL
jgi:hypothetical protein